MENVSEVIKKHSAKISLSIGFLICAIVAWIMVSGLFGINNADKTIVLQQADGNIKVIMDAGPYFKYFGKTAVYQKVIAINFTGDSKAEASSIIHPIRIRFLDTSGGGAIGVTRFRLPTTTEAMIKLHQDFGSQTNAISNLLTGHVNESAINSARTMTVEEHYSGAAGRMSFDFLDQLRNGVFLTEQTLSTSERASDTTTLKDESLSSRQRVRVIKKTDKTGEIVRRNNPLMEYGISVLDGFIQKVTYDKNIEKRLEAQQAASQIEAQSRQNLKKAEQEATTAKVEGEREIAIARAEQEKIRVVANIEAERKKEVAVTQASQAKEVALIEASQAVAVAKQRELEQAALKEAANYEAESLSILANARRKAGESALDPQKVFDAKLAALVKIEITKYEHMSKAKLVPNNVIGSGLKESGNALTTLDLMTLQTLHQLGLDLNLSEKNKKQNNIN